MLRLGLDVGSTTAKLAVIDGNGVVVFSRYERHHARVHELVTSYLRELMAQTGDVPVTLCVTGSVGMATAEQLRTDFVQEVVAATTYARQTYPEAKALIDIGGEDAKVVFFNEHNTELRMNGNCAGGTGAFLDQMAVLMGVSNSEMSNLALQSTHLYPIAARCGVFAKTDIQNLMSRNLPPADIAASIFHSVTVQTVTALSHGCDFAAPILLCGGPLTFLPALRKAFADYLKMSPDDFIVNERSNLMPALGCALRSGGEGVKLSELLRRLDEPAAPAITSDLSPLFASEAEHQQWQRRKNTTTAPLKPLQAGVQRVVIGIDSGSTTTKVIALRVNDDRQAELVFTYYAPNLGNPIQTAAQGLQALRQQADSAGAQIQIVGSCSTGYGEDLIKTAFGLDDGIIETMAHYRAASCLAPDVSFILDIGGQDMKAIFVENGAVVRMELNEACSSGCGTFIQTFASGLGFEIGEFANMACTAPAPCDLGTRCTVFMNSKVKQALRDGATVADISAGLAYSVVKNCLYKVLKLRGSEVLGSKVVVQGGTMRNDSIVRALEVLTGHEVTRSSMPEMMGALGCALHALHHPSQLPARTIDHLLQVSAYQTRQLQCKGCENRCLVSQYTFAGGSRFYSGNKCERVFNNSAGGSVRGNNIYDDKYRLLFDRPCTPLREPPRHRQRKIGIPRVLNMYENYPFWNTLLRACGFEVVLSGNSNFVRYERALATVMSDNICFPAKLVHSHIMQLEGDATLERIFMPYVVYEHRDDDRTLNTYNCPIVSGYSDVIKSSMEPSLPVDSPVINFADKQLLTAQVVAYLKSLGIGKRVAIDAIGQAAHAQQQYDHHIRERAQQILALSRQHGRLTLLLAGRPYHTDPLVQHKLSEMVAALGVDVISDDVVRGDNQVDAGEIYPVKQWAYINRIVKAGQWAAGQPADVHFVQMTSFGCGPDAFIQDEIRDILRRHGKPFTLLKIDDVSNLGSLKLRVRSLVESLREQNSQGGGSSRALPFVTTSIFTRQQAHRKIIVPFFTDYISPLLPALGKLAGYDIEVLPISDQHSVTLGLQYANNEVCYPATLVVGDIIKALKSGRYDPTRVAVAMSQTGGQCRATSYAGIIKRAMVANGFQHVPLITLGVSTHARGGNEQQGFDIPWRHIAHTTVCAILYGDTISKLYHSAVVRERQPGQARQLRDQYMQLVEQPIINNDHRAIVRLVGQAAAQFDAIVTHVQHVPRVGIVGEIFLKFHPFAHQHIVQHIISRGIEVVPPLLSPFFMQEFVNVEVRQRMRLTPQRVPGFALHHMHHQLVGKAVRRVNTAAARYRHWQPFTSIYHQARHVGNVVSMAAQFGEGWLLPADVIAYVTSGVNHVVALQPFGCIANHIVARGIERKLHKLYPQLNLLALDFDSGVSTANVDNRLLLFLDDIINGKGN